MGVEIFKKIVVFDVIKCFVSFYAIESYFNGTNFDTKFPEFSLRFNHKHNSNP